MTKQDRDSYRSEMIQVAAVALAAVSDYDECGDTLQGLSALTAEVEREREYQMNKWGSRHYNSAIWMQILLGELGEAAMGALKERV